MNKVYFLLSALLFYPCIYAFNTQIKVSDNTQDVIVDEFVSDKIRLSAKSFKASSVLEDEWQQIGEGLYKDVLFSDYFGKTSQTLKVVFEQNVADPTVYRIPNVYETMDFSEYGSFLTYDASKATPMVFHIFNDRYAYFEEFDTGVFMNYPAAGDGYVGEVRMLMQGVDFLASNDIETIAAHLPECLCEVRDGNLTLGSTFAFNSYNWSNILGLVYVTGTSYDSLFKGNSKGDFLVTLPGAEVYDPEQDWTDYGIGLFTDTFTEWVDEANPVYDTWEVKIQSNKNNSTLYRLVNPYANYKITSDVLTYDNSNNYYMEFRIQDYDGYSLVGIPSFYTGLRHVEYGDFAVSNQAADAIKTTDDFLTLYYYYPGCLGTLEDGVITYPSHCIIEMEYYQNFFGYFGQFNEYGPFVSGNSKGNFRLAMPGAGIDSIDTDANATAEYYNLQGVKVTSPSYGQLLIQKQGNKSKLIIFKK